MVPSFVIKVGVQSGRRPCPKTKNHHDEEQEYLHRVTRYCVSRHAECFPGGRVKNGELVSEDDKRTSQHPD